jgi:predicted nucleotidyltransferase
MIKNHILPNLEYLKEIFAEYPDILAVYLFGSYAEDREIEESDLDLAIIPKSSEIHQKKLDILSDLARLGFCKVDLVFLDTDDIVVKYEAIRLNNLIYQTDEFDRGTYYSLILRQYFDFYHYLNIQRDAYKRRVLVD